VGVDGGADALAVALRDPDRHRVDRCRGVAERHADALHAPHRCRGAAVGDRRAGLEGEPLAEEAHAGARDQRRGQVERHARVGGDAGAGEAVAVGALAAAVGERGRAGERGVGAAFDADVVPGFLTLTAGWSYARGAVARSGLSPALPLLDAHTFALGATVRTEGYNVVLGLSYAPAAAVDVDPGAAAVVAPLADGAPPAARGRLDASTTMIGLAVEAEL
jgi:hypothetical protein